MDEITIGKNYQENVVISCNDSENFTIQCIDMHIRSHYMNCISHTILVTCLFKDDCCSFLDLIPKDLFTDL